nr:unnamed protein product [Callosobruchus chinensis]
MPSLLTCTCCQKSYESHLLLICSVCKKLFKNTCVDVTSNELLTLNSNKGYEWSCKNCREFGCDLIELKALILKLQDDIQALKTENASLKQSSTSFSFEKVIEEISERTKIKKNILLFKVLEPNAQLPTDRRINEDRKEVQAIFNVVSPGFNGDRLKPVRLGKFE